MAKVKIKVDGKGLQQVKRSAGMSAAVQDAGNAIASSINETADGEPVEVDAKPYKTNKGQTSVVALKHPAGERIEAKRGTLRKAASAKGFKVKGGVKE